MKLQLFIFFVLLSGLPIKRCGKARQLPQAAAFGALEGGTLGGGLSPWGTKCGSNQQEGSGVGTRALPTAALRSVGLVQEKIPEDCRNSGVGVRIRSFCLLSF